MATNYYLAMNTEFRIIVAGLILMATSAGLGLVIDTILIHKKEMSMHGAVSTSSPICTEHAREMIRHGGSAVDAAIAASLCIGVVNAHSSGIGGGAFIMIQDEEGHVEVFDARETAPSGSTRNMFESRNQSRKGGLAVGVPGFLHGIYEAHKKYGRLHWEKLFGLAIKISEDGVKISPSMAHAMKTKISYNDMSSSKNLDDIYTRDQGPNCCLKTEEDTVTLKRLAETMTLIASSKIRSFYEGGIADGIISTVTKNGGIMKHSDLKGYESIVRHPLSVVVNGYKIFSVPPPSISVSILMVIKVLEKFHLTRDDFNKAETYRKILETLRHAYAAVEDVGDFGGNSEIAHVLNDKFLNRIYDQVKKEMIDPSIKKPNFGIVDENVGTSHISVIDGDGQVVSITTSINRWFGSFLMTDEGVILNDQMDDFTFPHDQTDNKNNFPSPGRRPRSAMSPIIMVDTSTGEKWAIGGTNGTRIPSGVVNVLINLIFRNMTLQEAIDAPRVHILNDLDVYYEKDFDRAIVTGLEDLGYRTVWGKEGLNVVNGVSYGREGKEAVGDSRKWGAGCIF